MPTVLPEQQSAVPVTEAAELAAWVDTADKAAVNCFMDEKFEEYRLTISGDGHKSEQELRATWARGTFYVHLRTFKEKPASRNPVLEALSTRLPDTEIRRCSMQAANINAINTD